MDLSHIELPGSYFEGSDASGVDFRFTDLTASRFRECNLSGTKWAGTGYYRTVFLNCTMIGAQLPSSDFTKAAYMEVDASRSTFASSDFTHSVWSDSQLVSATLDNATIQEAAFHHCDLSRASCRSGDFTGTSFHDSILNGADFSWSYLTGVRFGEASMSGVNLYGAVLEDIYLDSREQIEVSGTIKQALLSLFSYIGVPACHDVRDVLHAKVHEEEGKALSLPEVIWCGIETREEGKEERNKMFQAAKNFATGIVQHKRHQEGNPIAEILLEWLNEFLA